MKTKRNRFGATAGRFFLLDLVLVILVTGLILALLLAARPRTGKAPWTCASSLKMIGMSFRIWAIDNDGQLPMLVSTNKEGSMEYDETAEVFRHFYALRYALNTPKLLICPADSKRPRETNWVRFSNQNLSYFIGIDANAAQPQMILSGDRNVTGGILTAANARLFRSNSVAGWTSEIHNKGGNILLMDGSVRAVDENGLQQLIQGELQMVTNGVIRLAIP